MRLWFVVLLDSNGKLLLNRIEVFFSAARAEFRKRVLKGQGIECQVIVSFVCGSGY